MATTFTLNSIKYQARYMQLTCTQIPDIANNKSIINWTLTVIDPNNNYSYATGPTTVKINGVTVYYKDRVKVEYRKFPSVEGSISGTLEVAHDSNGAKSVECSILTAFYDVIPSDPTKNLKKGTWYLDSIPQESGVSCSTVNIGVAPTITIAKSDSSFTHTLKYEFYSLSGTIVEKTSALSYTDWVLPDSFYGEIPNSPSGTGKIICETYSGDTLLGTTECPFTANVNRATSDPMVSPTIKDTNEKTIALTGDEEVLIKYFSNASVTTGAYARNGATIVSQTTTNGSSTLSGSTCTFEGVESGQFSFTIEDSRGFIVYPGRDLAVQGKFIEYFLPTCNLVENRPDGSGNMTVYCHGNFFNGTFGKVANTLQVQYRYKTRNGVFGNWVNMTHSINGNSYTATANATGLDYRETYVFETRAVDQLADVSSTSSALKSLPVFHWSEHDFTFEVPVSFNAGASGYDQEEGTDLRDYITVDGKVMTIKVPAGSINLEANGVYVYGNPIPYIGEGSWTPYLNSAVVSSYETQYGWYSVLGQTVCVGFFIKANCKSGFNSTDISISGLPFTPMFSAAGGGMCSGAYVSAGFNFQCFVAENDSDKITTRVQACNNTSATNLSTSASGCKYPSGGGVLTLSGTITYMYH
jgi:hypothetical protein